MLNNTDVMLIALGNVKTLSAIQYHG